MSVSVQGTQIVFNDSSTQNTGGNPAKAWVNFNGSTATIRANYNVSSVTKNTTGDYTLNFTNALTDANYAVTGTCASTNAGYNAPFTVSSYAGVWIPNTTTMRFCTAYAGTRYDLEYVNIGIFR